MNDIYEGAGVGGAKIAWGAVATTFVGPSAPSPTVAE